MPSEETEFKRLARGPVSVGSVDAQLADLGLTSTGATSAEHEDRYLDDALGSLQLAGQGLRLRVADDGAVLCWKGKGRKTPEGAITRREIELPWTNRPLPTHARELPPRLRREVEPLVAGAPLKPVVRLHVRRDRRQLNEGMAELALDHVKVTDCGAGTHAEFTELELEVKQGDADRWVGAIEALTQQLDLAPSEENKLARSLRMLGLALPPKSTPNITADTPAAHALWLYSNTQLDKMRRMEAGARAGTLPNAMRKFRVAGRRARSALKAFGTVSDPVKQLVGPEDRDFIRTLLQQTGRMSGPVREFDVMLESLPDVTAELAGFLRENVPAIAGVWMEMRHQAHTEFLRFLEDEQRLTNMRDARERITRHLQTSSQDSPLTLGEIAGYAVSGAARRVRKRGRVFGNDGDNESAHDLRLAVKRLRYTMEVVAPAFGKRTNRWLTRTAKLQSILGRFHDADLARQWLLDWGALHGASVPGNALMAVGALASVFGNRAADARRELTTAWDAFNRKKTWSALQSMLAED